VIMGEAGDNSPGLFTAARRLLDTGLAAVQNRVELVAVELREEKCRFFELLLLASSALFLGMMAVIVLTAAVVLICPEEVRGYVAIFFGLAYALSAAVAFSGVRSRLKNYPMPLAETSDQIKKDREWLDSQN